MLPGQLNQRDAAAGGDFRGHGGGFIGLNFANHGHALSRDRFEEAATRPACSNVHSEDLNILPPFALDPIACIRARGPG